jgi:hypothetical protein
MNTTHQTEVQPEAAGTGAAQASTARTPAVSVEPAALSALIEASDKEHAARRRVPLVALIIGAQAALIVAYPHNPLTILFYAATVITLAFFLARSVIRYRLTTEALAAADDVRMVGPLIDRLRTGRRRPRTRRIVRQALLRLLPRLRASDAAHLTAEQHSRLSRTLARLGMLGRDTELQLAILGALQQIGGLQALPVVEHLAHKRSRSPKRRRVREAALACLPYLQQRARQEQARDTLLRAAGSEAVGVELLRAAYGAAGSSRDELLRAT